MSPPPYPTAIAAWLLGFAVACAPRPSLEPGAECDLNTECAAPLVCRLGHCRVECRSQRDCAPDLECVRDERGLGACQLPKETDCTLSSECEDFLLCHYGRCTNACASDRDCPPGSHCTEEPGGGRGCRDESTVECELNSDCDVVMGLRGYICANDGRCRVACRTDWDCSDGRECLLGESPPVCGWREPDAGPADASMDGGLDAWAPDAWSGDAWSGDAGADGGGLVSPPSPPRLAAGHQSTCAAPATGGPRCWGDNAAGQIGDGTTTRRFSATSVLGIASASLLGVGQGHACASDATVLSCWGNNASSQLGLGSTTPASSSSPLAVTMLPAGVVEDISLGAAHGCAIVAGALYCWGDNAEGQLGVGDRDPRLAPTEVALPGGESAVRVETFSVHTCALLASGAVACFGDNTENQVHAGATTADALSPMLVAGIADAADVATGSAHTCALKRDGTVWCWGSSYLGQIGDGVFRPVPMPVTSPTPTAAIPDVVVQITAGSAHSCALTRGGLVYCWGDNSSGQLGRDSAIEFMLDRPSRVDALTAIDEVAAGSLHTCVRTSAAAHLCFGDNAFGQLGRTGASSHTPMPVVWP